MAKAEDLVFTFKADTTDFRREIASVQRHVRWMRLSAWLALLIAFGVGLVIGVALGVAS